MDNRTRGLIILIVLGIFLLLALSNSIFLTIDAGHRGVLFKTFSGGIDKETVYTPGFHIIAPWNTMYVYNVQEQQKEERMDVLSSNGLSIDVDVSVRVNPKYNEVGYLHENFGKDYENTLVVPEVRSSVREVIGKYTAEELYSTQRDTVQASIFNDLKQTLGQNNIELKAFLFRSIKLPTDLMGAIERKLKRKQESEEYEFRLDRERKEAERKIIEAQAKAEANRIISASLTDKILQDKGIEATLELSNSPNTKVVIVGGGDQGLPLILNN